jgi:hypothetical protein
MWRELIWNIEFLRGFIFLVIGIVAAILLVPRIVKRMQVEKDKRLAKELMRGWSHTCMFGITGLKPGQRGAQYPRFESSESANWDLKGYEEAGTTISHLWLDIRTGKREPIAVTSAIADALEGGLYRDKESKDKELPREKEYSFYSSAGWIRSLVRGVLNTMYAKIEIFDVELLPITELEMAMSYLESFSKEGSFTMYQFMSYAFNLAESMEKFEKYLWKLDGRSDK